ncbi:MAG: 1,4-alpha-glucan branching enzyme [Lachnospiraceae bacterium]|nr:1,4-alpha-glucan branching enzyme [Lachnospiraceae bacterium]
MTKRLYKLMDWARIEGVVYSEEDNPHDFLGVKKELTGYLFQTFLPYAKKVSVVVKAGNDAKEYPMELVDEEGFYAAYVTKLQAFDKIKYYYNVTKEDGTVTLIDDPYRFNSTIDDNVLRKFNAGICYDIYNYLGAHVKTIDGVKGTAFAVFAPNAIRVSVIGDFNGWDGRIHQMRRLSDSGVFEIFIPGVKPYDAYKYEIKFKGSAIAIKSDPYGFMSKLRPGNDSVVADMKSFDFTDKEWIKNRRAVRADEPMAIYEVSLSSFEADEGSKFPNYMEIANELCEYVKKEGYTHIEITPVMEYPLDESLGFQTIGYFAPTRRYGEPCDFMYLINHMHENGIGVILDVNFASFPRDDHGLSYFDGTNLYEHKDERQGLTPDKKMCIFNYGRKEVSNYLISCALFWINVYHADGIKINDVAKMVYLDYDRNENEYVANIYGGNENLEAIDLLKHLNSINEKMKLNAMIIADGNGYYPMLTEKLSNGGLGFSYAFNTGFSDNLTDYIYKDVPSRKYHYDELTHTTAYAYSENYILPLSHCNSFDAGGSLLYRIWGDDKYKAANYKVLLGYLFTYPGKKLVFKEQLPKEINELIGNYNKDLLNLYKETKALYELDSSSEGFEWLENISSEKNILSFIRKSKSSETVLVVCNFSDESYEKYKLSVPFFGKYKEIFNSDSATYGGSDFINKRVKTSKKEKNAFRDDYISINVPPLGISIFNCTKVSE